MRDACSLEAPTASSVSQASTKAARHLSAGSCRILELAQLLLCDVVLGVVQERIGKAPPRKLEF